MESDEISKQIDDDLPLVNSPEPLLLQEQTATTISEPSNYMNFFQSSNYFSSAGAPFMPVGSEILFGVDKAVDSNNDSVSEPNSAGTNV